MEPRTSNHNIPLVYFSVKRENTLVYLSNAVEKYCVETGYKHIGKWHKWGSYGFTQNGILRLEEYYPNATYDTYKGVSAYIYSTNLLSDAEELKGIPFAFTAGHSVAVENCEFIPDAYEEIMKAAENNEIVLEKYEDMNRKKLEWVKNTVLQEYNDIQSTYEYKYFLVEKFPFLKSEITG